MTNDGIACKKLDESANSWIAHQKRMNMNKSWKSLPKHDSSAKNKPICQHIHHDAKHLMPFQQKLAYCSLNKIICKKA